MLRLVFMIEYVSHAFVLMCRGHRANGSHESGYDVVFIKVYMRRLASRTDWCRKCVCCSTRRLRRLVSSNPYDLMKCSYERKRKRMRVRRRLLRCCCCCQPQAIESAVHFLHSKHCHLRPQTTRKQQVDQKHMLTLQRYIRFYMTVIA